MAEPVEFTIMGTTGMDRNAPSQMLSGEPGQSWPCLEWVGCNPNDAPVIVLRLSFRDVGVNAVTGLPLRKTSAL